MRDQREEKRKSGRYKAKRFLSTHEGSGCVRKPKFNGEKSPSLHNFFFLFGLM